MELLFLGTGAGVPSKQRNVTAIALKLLQEQNAVWLFDCGEAAQHQILHTNLKSRKINKIFITHLHGDHIFGLPGLLSSRSFQGGEDPLTVYGPLGIKEYITTSLRTSGTHLTYPLHIEEITDGQTIHDGNFQIHIKKLDHALPCFGYRIVENDQPGSLLTDKLKTKGIMPGPIYKQLKDNEYVITSDGEKLYHKDFTGPAKGGRIVTIFGDTRFSKAHQSFAADSDVIVHEATFDKTKEAMAYEYFHSTNTQAATLAKNSYAKQLVLTHISSRYQKEDMKQLLEEAREIFPNTVIANDFYQLNIYRK